ncbi:hypothetical protein R2G56_07050 [Nitratireductor aquimarinus]|uniref:Uncharacterized protein n=1 Tax=Nitratireductor aquimarinus TaxID=889300 RepID=A0ABU4AIS5_9HYPH|nr:hypothetical protein [Nitratireductor aquimarinus]MDV6226041.1 hypothetical protein [Nitratireductor aquimarinus]
MSGPETHFHGSVVKALHATVYPGGRAPVSRRHSRARCHVTGDKAGKPKGPTNGEWTDAQREAYAGRVEAISNRHIGSSSNTIIDHGASVPADLEAMGSFAVRAASSRWRGLLGSGRDRRISIGGSIRQGAGLSGKPAGGSEHLLAEKL